MANFSNRQLSITGNKKAKGTEKLSTGYRINRSADDAAGLQISEKMRWQVRGLNKASENVQSGVSLLQVADGALSEVHDMLQRVNELAIQAANDTNTFEDRSAIQKEISEIMSEINRVGMDTEYNTQKIFQGGYEYMHDAAGKPIDVSSIPIRDLKLANTTLSDEPFTNSSTGSYMKLSASTVDGYTPASWNLIFGNGSTSNSTIRYTYLDDVGQQVTSIKDLKNMTITNFNYNGTDTYSRTFSYTGSDGISFDIEQKIMIEANDGEKQYYNLSYAVKNTGTRDAKVDFMFNADTAYNNNDSCEGYFIDGHKVTNFGVYTSPTNLEYMNQNPANVHDIASITNGFSIIDEDDALPFAEKILWDAADAPDSVSIGNWGLRTGDWSYYDNLSQMLGGSTDNRDIAFSLIWNRDIVANDTKEFSFKYGIIDTKKDTNLSGVTIKHNTSTGVRTDTLKLWIQSGALQESGMFIEIGELSTEGLGIRGVNVDSYENASDAITAIQNAISKVSKQRSSIGAQQNRLEHARLVDDNTAENTQAAESGLRDTDMAKEMVELSKHGILEQAGQSMLAQANNINQGVLSLLQ